MREIGRELGRKGGMVGERDGEMEGGRERALVIYSLFIIIFNYEYYLV